MIKEEAKAAKRLSLLVSPETPPIETHQDKEV
jgi:hypothetical protein